MSATAKSTPAPEELPTLDDLPTFEDAHAASDWLVRRGWRCLGVLGSPGAKWVRPGKPFKKEVYSKEQVFSRYAPDNKLLPQLALDNDGNLVAVWQVHVTVPCPPVSLDEALAEAMEAAVVGARGAEARAKLEAEKAEAATPLSLAEAQARYAGARHRNRG